MLKHVPNMWIIRKLLSSNPLFFSDGVNNNTDKKHFPPTTEWKISKTKENANIIVSIININNEIITGKLDFSPPNHKESTHNIKNDNINNNLVKRKLLTDEIKPKKRKISILHPSVSKELGELLRSTYKNQSQAIDSIAIDGLLNNDVLKDAVDEILSIPFNEVYYL